MYKKQCTEEQQRVKQNNNNNLFSYKLFWKK